MKTVNIGLLGLGTVGSGVINVLARNEDEIKRRIGRDIRITHATARNLDKPHLSLEGIHLSNDPFEVVNAPDVDIVVELIGGCGIAKALTEKAIENGKHIVSANKALIAEHGNELFKLAADKKVMFAYEAAVAAGIPIIKALREGLAANKINNLAGIINGTGNFILSEMQSKGRNFDEVLKEAQSLGYAEADPTFDVEGIDAAHKLTILASIAFGIPLQFDQVYIEGITQITRQDVSYADELGYRIKHLGISKRTAGGIELRVHPALIPKRCLLANVNGVMNGVFVESDAVGPSLYYGAGAGSEATASAVIADVLDVVRTLDSTISARVAHYGFQADTLSDEPILSIDDVESAYYLRVQAQDRPGVMAKLTRIIGDADISIEAIVQKEPEQKTFELPIFMLTHKAKEKQINEVIKELEALDVIDGSVTRIRVEYLTA